MARARASSSALSTEPSIRFAITNIQDTPQEARYLERAPSAPITGREAVHCTTVQCTARWAPNGGPKMSVDAAGGLELAPSGRAHHSHLPRVAGDGLAHLCTDPGVGLARAHASSTPLSAEPSIQFCPDRHPGHSSGSALFRKGTFGADKYNISCGAETGYNTKIHT